jgi:hypothetical protein
MELARYKRHHLPSALLSSLVQRKDEADITMKLATAPIISFVHVVLAVPSARSSLTVNTPYVYRF